MYALCYLCSGQMPMFAREHVPYEPSGLSHSQICSGESVGEVHLSSLTTTPAQTFLRTVRNKHRVALGS